MTASLAKKMEMAWTYFEGAHGEYYKDSTHMEPPVQVKKRAIQEHLQEGPQHEHGRHGDGMATVDDCGPGQWKRATCG